MPPKTSDPPIMVTGAAGFVGSAIIRALHARGERLQAVIRPQGREAPVVGPGLELVRAQLPDVTPLLRLEPPRVVYHLASIVDPRFADDASACWRVNVAGTEKLARWALERGSRFIMVSSIAAMGFHDAPAGIDEQSPCRPTTAYGRSKLEAERRLGALAAAGLRCAIIRPPTLYGPEDRYNFLSLARAVAARRFVLFDGGRNRMSIMGVDNLIAALLTVGESRACGLFVADDGEPTTLRQIAAAISRALGRSGRNPSVPHGVGYLAARLIEPTCRVLHVQPPLSRERLRTLTSDFGFRIDRLRRAGYRQVLSTEAGIAQAVAGYRQRGVL